MLHFFSATCTVKVSSQVVSQVAFETPREELKDLRVVSVSFLSHRHHTLLLSQVPPRKKKKKKVQQKRRTRLQALVSIKTPPVTQSLHNANLPYEYLHCKYNGDEQSAST